MKVLVTGASGRVGSMLVKRLQTDGHWVRGFDIAAPSADDGPDDFVPGSLLDAYALAPALVGIEGVIHLAAYMSWHPDETNKLFEINVNGTFNLLQAAKNCDLQRFVVASSGEVYPELNPIYLPIDESHPTHPTSPYGMTKLLGETMVKNVAAQTGMPYCAIRFAHTQAAEELLDPESFFSGPRFFVDGKIRQLRTFPSQPPIENSIAALEAAAADGATLYAGCAPDGQPYRMAICDVRDMITGLTLALTRRNAAGETINVGPAASFDFDEAVSYMAQKTGLPMAKVRLETTSYRYDTSIDKAKDLLGYTPQFDIYQMIDDAASARGFGEQSL